MTTRLILAGNSSAKIIFDDLSTKAEDTDVIKEMFKPRYFISGVEIIACDTVPPNEIWFVSNKLNARVPDHVSGVDGIARLINFLDEE